MSFVLYDSEFTTVYETFYSDDTIYFGDVSCVKVKVVFIKTITFLTTKFMLNMYLYIFF